MEETTQKSGIGKITKDALEKELILISEEWAMKNCVSHLFRTGAAWKYSAKDWRAGVLWQKEKDLIEIYDLRNEIRELTQKLKKSEDLIAGMAEKISNQHKEIAKLRISE